MKKTIFISYAWREGEHNRWVRLLALHLRQIGYTVLIDKTESYGSSLSGFMREVSEVDRVLMIVDENYVTRADRKPESGVGVENAYIKKLFEKKPAYWLSAIFIDNSTCVLPAWLEEHKPKGFNFNSFSKEDNFGLEQLDDLWRWVEGLPADKAHALSVEALFERIARIERADAVHDPVNHTNALLNDRVTFFYEGVDYYKTGYGEYEFKIKFSDCGKDNVYAYIVSGMKGYALITAPDFDPQTIEFNFSPGRHIVVSVGQTVVVMNDVGALCFFKIEGVQQPIHGNPSVPGEVTFEYKILPER